MHQQVCPHPLKNNGFLVAESYLKSQQGKIGGYI